ncbi:MAG: iron ABC transporter permease [Planctomycetota bacterium]|nr:iron ABC transporter permease [Planctomycetota bacterium]
MPAADLSVSADEPAEHARSPLLAPWLRIAPACFALAAAGVVASVAFGPVRLTLAEVWAVLWNDAEGPARTIVWELRLPRALAGALVGMNLAVAGAVLQGTMRNALASPDILGVTSGAALAATALMVLYTGLPTFLPLVAFAGALCAAVAVYAISWQPGQGTSPTRMVLSGVAVGSMLGAITTFLMVYFSDRAQPVVLWLAGSMNAVNWSQVKLVLPYSVAGLAVAWALARSLNLLQLGEDAAAGLGLPLQRVRTLALVASALLAGAAICVTGPIGFIGLLIPHILRMLGASDYRVLIPTAAVAGAALLVWADLAARALGEMPVGILTAAAGGPYFVYLLYRKKLL